MKNLLIVDDEENYRFALEFALRRDFNIFLAKNMVEAIDILENNKPKIDVSLVDIRLDAADDNNIDGIKILEWVMVNKKQTDVFMMSSYKVFSCADKDPNSAVKHFLGRPIDIKTLKSILMKMGAKHFFEKPIDIRSLKSILKEKSTQPDG